MEEITIRQLEEWIEIRKESYMSKKLPKCYVLQDKINEMFGLSKEVYLGNGIYTMCLDRGQLLRLTLEIMKLKATQNSALAKKEEINIK